MRSSLKLGTPFGIPVGLHWSALLVGLLAVWALASSFASAVPDYPEGTYWVAGLLAVGLYFGGLVLHELAHAVAARRHGIGTKGVTLWALGGLAELERQPSDPRAELRVALAGPLASLALGAAFIGLAAGIDVLSGAGVLATALLWVGVVNVVLGVFNLLPARPMDGGRVLTAVLWKRHGDQSRATVTATKVATVLAWGLAGIGGFQLVSGGVGGLWLLLVAWFVMSSAKAERRVHEWRGDLAGTHVGQIMGPPPPTLPAWTGLRDAAEVAGSHPRQLLLVVDHDGRPQGVAPAGAVTRMALTRPDAALVEVVRPLPPEAAARSEEQIADLMVGARAASFPLLVLGPDGRVIGQVTAEGLERWARYRRQGHATWAPPSQHHQPVG